MYTFTKNPSVIQLVKWQDQTKEMIQNNHTGNFLCLNRSNELEVNATGKALRSITSLARKVQPFGVEKSRIVATLEEAYVYLLSLQKKFPALRSLNEENIQRTIQTMDPINVTVKELDGIFCQILDSDVGSIATALAKLDIFTSLHTGYGSDFDFDFDFGNTMDTLSYRLTETLTSSMINLTTGDDEGIPARMAVFEEIVIPKLRAETRDLPIKTEMIVASNIESRKKILHSVFNPKLPAPLVTTPAALMQWLAEDVRKIEINNDTIYPDGHGINKQASKLHHHLSTLPFVALSKEDIAKIQMIKAGLELKLKNDFRYRDYRLSFDKLFQCIERMEILPDVSDAALEKSDFDESPAIHKISGEISRITGKPRPASPEPQQLYSDESKGATGGVSSVQKPIHPLESQPVLTTTNYQQQISSAMQSIDQLICQKASESEIKDTLSRLRAATQFIRQAKSLPSSDLQALLDMAYTIVSASSHSRISIEPLIEVLQDVLLEHLGCT